MHREVSFSKPWVAVKLDIVAFSVNLDSNFACNMDVLTVIMAHCTCVCGKTVSLSALICLHFVAFLVNRNI